MSLFAQNNVVDEVRTPYNLRRAVLDGHLHVVVLFGELLCQHTQHRI